MRVTYVTMDCDYQAKMTFHRVAGEITGPEIERLKKEKPGYGKQEVTEALRKSLCSLLDDEFEDYCTEDDYYPPVVEDFDAEYYAGKWAEERGLKLIRLEGKGSDSGYERRSRW